MKAPKNKPQWFLIGGSLTGLIAASLAQSGLCPQLFPLAGYLQILSVSTLAVSLLYKRPTSYQVKQHCPAIPLAAGILLVLGMVLLYIPCVQGFLRWFVETFFSLGISLLFACAENYDREIECRSCLKNKKEVEYETLES